MGEPSLDIIDLTCPGCSAQFRLRPTGKELPTGDVDCPRCGSQIPIPEPEPEPEGGVQTMSVASVFGRKDERPEPRPGRDETDEKGRVFRDITSIDPASITGEEDRDELDETSDTSEPSEFDEAPPKSELAPVTSATIISPGDEDDGEPEPEEPPAPAVPRAPENQPRPGVTGPIFQNVRERLKKKLAEEKADESDTKEESAEIVLDDLEDAIEQELLGATGSEADDAPPPMPESEQADLDDVDPEDPVRLRVDDRTFGPLELPEIADLMKSGLWVGVVEIELPSGRWISFSRHPLFPAVRRRLAEEAQSMLSLMESGEWPRHTHDHDRNHDHDHANEHDHANAKDHEHEHDHDHEHANVHDHDHANAHDHANVHDHDHANAHEHADDHDHANDHEHAHEHDHEHAHDHADFHEHDHEHEHADAHDHADVHDQDDIRVEVEPLATNYVDRPDARKRRRTIATFTTMAIVFALGVVATYIFVDAFKSAEKKQAPAPTPPPTPPPEAMEFAFHVGNRASVITEASAELRRKDPEELLTEAEEMLDAANYGTALDIIGELHRRNPRDPLVADLRVRALFGARAFRDARSAAVDGWLWGQDDEKFREYFEESIRRDPALKWRTLTVNEDERVTRIRALGGGKSLSFKMYRNGTKVYAYKPAQAEWEEGWRAEIAAWALCEILECSFEIPDSYPMRVSRSEFETLYPTESRWQESYAERFEEMVWVEEPGPDAVEREYLYGVAKDWVPHFVDWPIEYTDVWKPWLDPEADDVVLERPLEDAIAGLKPHAGGEHYRRVLAERGSATTRDVARQLSDIMVFDYLTNNWDRFSLHEDYYGVNNQFADGRFVSIDNGASFHLQPSDRVRERFEPVRRFSRSTIASLRMLRPRFVEPFLLPDPSPTERVKLDVFWKQRELLLDKVDRLVEEYGEDAVLTFE